MNVSPASSRRPVLLALGRLSVLAAALAAGVASTRAAPVYTIWNGTADNVWSNAANWSKAPSPGATGNAEFQNTGNHHTTIDVGSDLAVNTLVFDNSDGLLASYVIGAGGPGKQTLTLPRSNSGILVQADAAHGAVDELIDANLVLGDKAARRGNFNINNNGRALLTVAGAITLGVGSGNLGSSQLRAQGSGNVTLAGAISDGANPGYTLGVTKSGAGTLTLAGSNAYGGNTTIADGILVAASPSALGPGPVWILGGTLSASADLAGLDNITLASGSLALRATTATLAAGKVFSMTGGRWTLAIVSTASHGRLKSAGGGTFRITGGTLDLTGGAIDYRATYALLDNFTSGSVSGLAITGYDRAAYTASLSNSGVLSFAATGAAPPPPTPPPPPSVPAIPEPSSYGSGGN